MTAELRQGRLLLVIAFAVTLIGDGCIITMKISKVGFWRVARSVLAGLRSDKKRHHVASIPLVTAGCLRPSVRSRSGRCVTRLVPQTMRLVRRCCWTSQQVTSSDSKMHSSHQDVMRVLFECPLMVLMNVTYPETVAFLMGYMDHRPYFDDFQEFVWRKVLRAHNMHWSVLVLRKCFDNWDWETTDEQLLSTREQHDAARSTLKSLMTEYLNERSTEGKAECP